MCCELEPPQVLEYGHQLYENAKCGNKLIFGATSREMREVTWLILFI